MVIEIAEPWAVSEAHDLATDPDFLGGFRIGSKARVLAH